jgi:hypothetical protein
LRCGTLELDVASALGGGLGPNHPDVIAAQRALDDCKSTSPVAAR